jgi:hypothetical protein
VGNYAITPYTTVPIAVEFLRLYNYRFIGATYRIKKLPLTVTALDIPDLVYGG